jgi:hypothetical protein
LPDGAKVEVLAPKLWQNVQAQVPFATARADAHEAAQADLLVGGPRFDGAVYITDRVRQPKVGAQYKEEGILLIIFLREIYIFSKF